jgi:alpha-tubulin suppressor-like RCC1 family protein
MTRDREGLYIWYGTASALSLFLSVMAGAEYTPPAVPAVPPKFTNISTAFSSTSLLISEQGHLWIMNDHLQRQDATTNLRAVQTGSSYRITLDTTGRIRTSGFNTSGQLGNGGIDYQNDLNLLTTGHNGVLLPTFTAISAGRDHSMALDTSGRIWTWGNGGRGKLGHNGTANEHRPRMLVMGHDDALLPPFTQISAGEEHSMAVDALGRIWTWGNGTGGGLGHGVTQHEQRPRMIEGISGLSLSVRAISARGSHSMAVCALGNVWTWGSGGFRLGHGGTSDEQRPRMIEGTLMFNVQAISAGGNHSMALDGLGNLWTWGSASLGVQGHGEWEGNESTPRIVMFGDGGTFLPPFTAICTSTNKSMALDFEGNIWTWGRGQSGLGHGDQISRNVPTRITRL